MQARFNFIKSLTPQNHLNSFIRTVFYHHFPEQTDRQVRSFECELLEPMGMQNTIASKCLEISLLFLV